MKKQISVKKVLILEIITVLVLSGVVYVLAATPSTTFYISSGVYPGAPSYTVWREGNNYFAKDGYGQVDYSGTNGTLVIQDAFTNTPLGGSIMLEAGDYYIKTLVIPSYRTVYGENPRTSLFIQAGGAGVILNGTSDAPIRKVLIHDLTFDTESEGSGSICLTLNFAQWDCSFSDLYFYINGTTAIYLYGGCWGNVFKDLTVMGGLEDGNSDYGIVLEPENATTTNNFNSFENCFFGNIEYGITIQDGTANYVTMCGFQGSNVGWGVRIFSHLNSLANGNVVEKSYFESVKWGIRIGTDAAKNAYGNQISGNYFNKGTRHMQLLNGTMNTTILGGCHYEAVTASIQIDAGVNNTNLMSIQIMSGGGIIDNGGNTQTWP